MACTSVRNIIRVTIPLQLLPHLEHALVSECFSLVRSIADAGYVKPQTRSLEPDYRLSCRIYLDLNDSIAAIVEDNARIPFFLAHDSTY